MTKKLTNQQLLQELEQRLPNFNQTEFTILTNLMIKHRQEVWQVIQTLDPEAHNWMLKKVEEWDQEQMDKKTQKIKKALEK